MTFKLLQMERGKRSLPTQKKLEKILSFKKKKSGGWGEEFSLHGNNLSSKFNLGLSLCLLFLYSVLYFDIVVVDRVLMHCSKTNKNVCYLSHEFWVEFWWGSKSSPLFFVEV